MSRHLWEWNHPYYCEKGCYYANDCHNIYGSWAEFLEEYGIDKADIDMNRLHRWDWKIDGDIETGSHMLSLFYVGQRKARPWSMDVMVCPADEPAVREFLVAHWEHNRKIWAGISSSECDLAEAPEPYNYGKTGERITECDCCGAEDVVCKNYARPTPHVFSHESGATSPVKADRWFCEICANTMVSSISEYRSGDEIEAMKVTAYCTNKMLKSISQVCQSRCNQSLGFSSHLDQTDCDHQTQ